MTDLDKIRAQVEQHLARVLNDRASELTPGGSLRVVRLDKIFIRRADGERALRELMQTRQKLYTSAATCAENEEN